jgi:hypothetical protein
MFDDATALAVAQIAARINVDPASLLAVAEVESGGKAFVTVGDRPEPLIRFEGHYFDRRLSGAKRARARAEGLAAPRAGAVPNPASQAARWAMLDRAAGIDRRAAYESVSWGVGQVMGAHWESLGFSSVDELVALCRASVAGQVDIMARFVTKNGLAPALRSRDWAAFARGYNGAGYKKNAYDVKMAAAYARWRKKGVTVAPPPAPNPEPAPRPTPVPVDQPKSSPAPSPAPKPQTPPAASPAARAGILAAVVAAAAAAAVYLANLPCQALGIFCGG